jgi:bacterioferritin-associated ferredoxin
VLVCHCAAVNDRCIRAAIAAGARDLVAIAQACGAGVQCGGCVPTIAALLAEPAAASQPLVHGQAEMVELLERRVG